jgi:hypothetical protein
VSDNLQPGHEPSFGVAATGAANGCDRGIQARAQSGRKDSCRGSERLRPTSGKNIGCGGPDWFGRIAQTRSDELRVGRLAGLAQEMYGRHTYRRIRIAEPVTRPFCGQRSSDFPSGRSSERRRSDNRIGIIHERGQE